MKSVLRLYVTTSKGNDGCLYRELLRLGVRPKYDNHFHAFRFDAALPTLFRLAHRVLTAQNLYVQVGQPFKGSCETAFQQSLQRIQFKNYLPLRPGLIENLTLNILVRETSHPISDNAMTSFLHNAIAKEIIRREYHREIMQGHASKDALPNYYDMKEIVERKWELEREMFEKDQLLLGQQKSSQGLIGSVSANGQLQSPSEIAAGQPPEHGHAQLQRPSEKAAGQPPEQSQPKQQYQLPFQPRLTLYVRRNKARILLKVNQEEMYKLGWKKRVGWAPVRESIATAVLSQSGLLDLQDLVIWDPFCGSATLPIVAAAMYYGALVRMEAGNFNWTHWSVFKPEYLEQYFQQEQAQLSQRASRLRLVCSDISFQASNYALANLRELEKSINSQTLKQQTLSPKQPVYKRVRPTEQWSEVMEGDWVVGCGDFQKLAQSVLIPGANVNIVTNLPYLKGRSAQHMPLSQLLSVYRRFSKMLKLNKDRISNVFILIDNENITHPNHFLAVSEEEWTLLNSFDSGGTAVGLYGWKRNQLKAKYEDLNALVESLKKEVSTINKVPQEQLQTALIKYRKKLSEIQRKFYYLPKHLLQVKRGWKRVLEKRRRRHLLQAYELFSKRRDKLIAFTTYARKKLEIGMLRRGAVWRRRNIRLLTGLNIQSLEKDLVKEFEGKIQSALKKSEEKENFRKTRAKESNAQRQLAQKPDVGASRNARTKPGANRNDKTRDSAKGGKSKGRTGAKESKGRKR